MTDIATEQPRAHARIVYLGPVSPHWEVYGDTGPRYTIRAWARGCSGAMSVMGSL